MSLHFQSEAIDVVDAVHGIKTFFQIIGKLKVHLFSPPASHYDLQSSALTDGPSYCKLHSMVYYIMRLVHMLGNDLIFASL